MNDMERNVQSWYAPLEHAAEPVKEPKKKKREKKQLSAAWKAGLAVLLVLALITGSSLLFSSGEEAKLPGPGFTLPGPNEPESEKDMPDDFRDFFEDFFVTEDRGGEIRIPRAEKIPEFTLEFSEPGEELTLQELYLQCADSIVSITGESTDYAYYWGSGIIMSEDGLILTNTHVVEDCDNATVTLSDGQEFEALLVGADATSDIAVLKIEAAGLRPVSFGDSAKLQVGDRIAAIGNPIGEEFHLSLSEGIVSGLDRGVGQYGRNVTAIQITAAINEGSSGGALFNMYGQVVGVTNMKMSAPIGEVTIEGMGLAVPTALARTVANALIRDGEVRGRTALGITVGPIPEMAVSHYEIPDGLYVSAVAENSDAAAKGIRKGDILTAMNGEALTSTDQVYEAKSALRVGDTLHFTVWRDGKTFELDVALIDFNDVY